MEVTSHLGVSPESRLCLIFTGTIDSVWKELKRYVPNGTHSDSKKIEA